MAKKHKKKGKKMSTTNEKPKTKTNLQFFGHEIIRVRKAKFVEGQSVGSYLEEGGTKGQLRAGIKSGAIELEAPETAEE